MGGGIVVCSRELGGNIGRGSVWGGGERQGQGKLLERENEEGS